MLDKKQIDITSKIIKQLIKEDRIIIPPLTTKDFFLSKSISSLAVSKKLLEIAKFEKSTVDYYMWVINTSYYSMFYAVTALLAYYNKKINSEIGIHKLTYHALVYYFLIEDNKIQKHFIEEYGQSYFDAEQLLQITESKTLELINNYDFEHIKRERFTYELGMDAERNKAETSLKRAQDFVTHIRYIIKN